MWSIRVLTGSQAGQIFDLKLGKNIFGRGGQSEFKILSVGISKEHCEIHVYKDKVILVDLKSSNGTFVNGIKVQNSIIKLGDKVSLFDVIMDVIPTPDIRPNLQKPTARKNSNPSDQPISNVSLNGTSQFSAGANAQIPSQMQYPVYGNQALQIQNYHQAFDPSMQTTSQPHGDSFVNGQSSSHSAASAPALQKTMSEKIDDFIELKVMPAIYQISFLLPFKQVLLGFVLIFVVSVTLFSMFPLTTIIKESNFIEASKRAKSVARTMAKANETFLLSGQLGNLTVQEALKEDGIKEAIIIQQADGAIVAPIEKAGRESNKPFLAQVRKESRSLVSQVDSKTIVASHPIGVYDPISSETSIKYHSIVYYDISSLNVDEGRVISLFMQTLVIASIFGIVLYFLFSRLISFPLKSLNAQIDTALREKSDRTEVKFDDPEVQKIVANVNLLLNRMWNGVNDDSAAMKPQQNRDVEFSNIVNMLTQPGLVLNRNLTIVSMNSQFETISQVQKDQVLQQEFTALNDPALVQNISGLIEKSKQSVYEKHIDRIPFSQFECEIAIQAMIDTSGEPEYYFITLTKVEPN